MNAARPGQTPDNPGVLAASDQPVNKTNRSNQIHLTEVIMANTTTVPSPPEHHRRCSTARRRFLRRSSVPQRPGGQQESCRPGRTQGRCFSAGHCRSVKKLGAIQTPVVTPAPTPIPPQPKPAPAAQSSCRQAIAQTWPANLHGLAVLTMSKENGREDPARVSVANSDGSQDFGCFQINNSSHPTMLPNRWSDPVQNAAYAYQHIFASRGNWSAWYAVCTPGRVPKYPGIWCN
jgi:hypothetical protein